MLIALTTKNAAADRHGLLVVERNILGTMGTSI
jgi:hypothetical protein